MAKKSSSKKSEKRQQIKILLSPDEHRRVRLAAAMLDMTMTEFCRDEVVKRANELTKDIKLPDLGG